MKLFSYWRSTCSWRVRIALELKQAKYEIVPVNLIAGEGEQKAEPHTARNPMAQVPVLEVDGKFLHQSVAILEYLEEKYPDPALLPKDTWARAQTRALVEIINSGIQPLQNLSVGRYLSSELKVDERKFHAHFVSKGLHALEKSVRATSGMFCVGDNLTLADVCLVPQMMGARRFGISLEECPTLVRIEGACLALPAFHTSAPDRHPGAVPN